MISGPAEARPGGSAGGMDFVLALHSHLPWVLHHGRWPHGSDWLCEAAVDTYLPLLGAMEGLETRWIPAPITLGVTPVLANQLAHPGFARELEAFLAQRIAACDEAIESFRRSHESHLIPIAWFWRGHLRRLRRTFERAGRDIPGALATLAGRGRIELMTSAATHGFLPLLARDESIRLQLLVGRLEHERLFRQTPAGCWLPECAYRNAGPWAPLPTAPAASHRAGTDAFLAEAGFRYFFVDSHMAEAGESLGLYGEPDVGEEIKTPGRTTLDRRWPRSPYRSYQLPGSNGRSIAVLVRDPRASLRVWSRWEGYPGDEGYLEFHKIRFPGGLKFWRVTGLDVDLGGKLPYDPNVARARAFRHAADLSALLESIAASTGPLGGEVTAVPFDTELFGHWWFEGLDFLGDLYRRLSQQGRVRPASASEHLGRHPPAQGIRLVDGSWGANGDYSKWLNGQTEWTWERLWPLESRFWEVVRSSDGDGAMDGEGDLVAQTARELVLAQASDWQFIISTGAATDYAEKRFLEHCDNLDLLLGVLERRGSPADVGAALGAMMERNGPFPGIAQAVARISGRG